MRLSPADSTLQHASSATGQCAHPTFHEALRTWAYIGLNSFGGPAGQIAVMHRVLVDEKKWIAEDRFLHALNYCMLLPGPEAQQLATYVGWLLHGWRGGITAGTLFVLPGIVAILALSYVYAVFRQVAAIEALFFGLKAAVLAIVAEAVLRIGKRALKSRFHVGVAASAFVAIYFFDVPFPLIVIGAAALGVGYMRFTQNTSTSAADTPVAPSSRGPRWTRSLKVVAFWLTMWFLPLVIAAAIVGLDSVYVQVGAFFSKAAVVTFGGAYSVLAYIAQEAVSTYQWLTPDQMLDGLAMAETTPGPLIMVVQFVGFMAAYQEPGGLPPLLAGTICGLLTTWVTFAPCFLWIFLGAPYIEALRGHRRLNAALSSITAAVVGVVLNLAVWFALHAVFEEVDVWRGYGLRLFIPHWSSVNWAALALASAAMVATFRFHVGTLKVLGACALAGLVFRFALGG